jgi:NADP-dependent 3-hydroxy acid dehydrogenase YdfG
MADKPLVMITGASAGIGQETARVFSAAGHPLLLVARRPERIEEMGLPDTLAVEADVRDYEALAAAIRTGEEKFGPVDCLINNAGISRLARLDEQDPEQWRDLIDINCIGVLNGMHAVAPGMKERRRGTIINLSSIAGRKVYPHHDVYGGTKHFVHAVTEGMRQTMSAHNVRVMVISPGVTKSEIDKTITHQNAYDFWNKGREAMGGGIDAVNVARTMLFAYQLPQDVILQEMTITHTSQEF